jgi:aromatic ring-opening dioxygenase catalytic subunit (LigB family)
MAELVAAVAASHAPMITGSPESADAAQKDRVYAGMAALRAEVERARPDALIICSNEHFTNFFLDNFPPYCIGVGERHVGPAESWLRIERGTLPGHPALGRWLVECLLAADFDPAFSADLCLDHGVMTVLHFLDPGRAIPVVPIVQNCGVEPMPTLGRCYRLGAAIRRAVEAWPVPARVALVGAGGLSHWVGMPGMGRINADFDRWFLGRLAAGRLEDVLSLTDAEIEQAGNGAHEIRSWLTVAGAVPGKPARVLAYEPVQAWVTGMGVVTYADHLEGE